MKHVLASSFVVAILIANEIKCWVRLEWMVVTELRRYEGWCGCETDLMTRANMLLGGDVCGDCAFFQLDFAMWKSNSYYLSTLQFCCCISSASNFFSLIHGVATPNEEFRSASLMNRRVPKRNIVAYHLQPN